MKDSSLTTNGIVAIGTTVLVQINSGAELPFTIVFSGKGDPDNGTVSCDAPLGKALLGHIAGEKISYKVMDKIMTVEVKEIVS